MCQHYIPAHVLKVGFAPLSRTESINDMALTQEISCPNENPDEWMFEMSQ